MRAIEWRVRTVMWICAVQWVTCGANAPDRIAGALQMNTQPCLNGTGNNLVHRGFDRAFGRGARRVRTRPSAKYIYTRNLRVGSDPTTVLPIAVSIHYLPTRLCQRAVSSSRGWSNNWQIENTWQAGKDISFRVAAPVGFLPCPSVAGRRCSRHGPTTRSGRHW